MLRFANHYYVSLAIGLGIATYGWRSTEARPQPYVQLSAIEASKVTGGQTGCPTQYFSYTTGCPYTDPGNCPLNGNACGTPPGGGTYACKYDCTLPANTALTSGGTNSGKGSIVSTPCPSKPSYTCLTSFYFNHDYNEWYTTCGCVDMSERVSCSGGNGYYLGFSTCAQ